MRKDAQEWKKGMTEEFEAHVKNKTWSVVKYVEGMSVIGCKWVYKLKRDVNGSVTRYKARIVAKGYNQQYGIDYNETFAPVLKYKSLRIIFALSITHKNTRLEQLDVKTAFLNAYVNEDVYMEAPEGMNVKSDEVLKLNKALYGIKQAPKEWNNDINNYIVKELGFVQCVKDTCVYVKM
jgi:hypothetical protein